MSWASQFVWQLRRELADMAGIATERVEVTERRHTVGVKVVLFDKSERSLELPKGMEYEQAFEVVLSEIRK